MRNPCSYFTRPKPIAWFFFLLGFGMTVAFGTWQVKRLEWKQDLIAELAEANAEKPLKTLPTSMAALESLQFRKVQVQGTWVPNVEFHLTPRYLHDKFGYGIITPLKLTDGRTLLVNRGWVPAANKDLKTRPDTKVKGFAKVTGLIRVGAERNYITPANSAEKNIWFARDIPEMAAYARLQKTIPVMLDQTGEQTKKLPIPSDGVIRLRNDHLSYVITWYGIALGILAVFLTYHRKKKTA